MRIILRFYKRGDLDLMALKKYNISLAKMAKQVLEAYANGTMIHFLLPQISDEAIDNEWFKDNGQDVRRVEFTTNDANTIKLAKSCKPTYRNLMIKTLMRNALYQQSLSIFFTDAEIVKKENHNISVMNPENIPNFVPLTQILAKGCKSCNISDILITPEERKEKKAEKKPGKVDTSYLIDHHIIKEAKNSNTKTEAKETSVSNETNTSSALETSDIEEMKAFLSETAVSDISEINEVSDYGVEANEISESSINEADANNETLTDADQEELDAMFNSLISEIP